MVNGCDSRDDRDSRGCNEGDCNGREGGCNGREGGCNGRERGCTDELLDKGGTDNREIRFRSSTRPLSFSKAFF